MRVVQYAITEVDQYIEEAQRAKNHLDSERWRAELRPRDAALRITRGEAHLVARARECDRRGTLPRRPLPGVDRHNGRQNRFARLARRLRVCLPRTRSFAIVPRRHAPDHHCPDSLARLGPVKTICRPVVVLRCEGLRSAAVTKFQELWL